MTEQLISTQKEKLNFNAPGGQMRIAYFILVHRFPEQFKRLFKAIYHPENYYLIHLDKKTSLEIYDDIQDFLANFLNAYMLDRSLTAKFISARITAWNYKMPSHFFRENL